MALSYSLQRLIQSALGSLEASSEFLSKNVIADGSVPFTATVAGITPVSSGHLATKGYVDGALPTVPTLVTYTSSAGAGGAATEVMVLTGLLATDTILAVSQSVVGANGLALVGYNTLANNALTAVWHADPGAGSKIVVTVKR